MKKILTASAYVLLAACTAYSHKAMEEQEQFVVETPYAETPAIDDTVSPGCLCSGRRPRNQSDAG